MRAALATLVLSAPAAAQVCTSEVLLQSLDAGAPGPKLVAPDGPAVTGGAFSLRVEHGPAGAIGALGLGFVEAPQLLAAYGATLHPQLAVLAPFALDGAGASPKLLTLAQVDPAFCGLDLIAQAAVQDPAATGGLAFSNGLRMRAGAVVGPLFPSLALSVSHQPEALAGGDLNGDGDADLLVAVNQTNALQVFLGDGDGTFTQQPSAPIFAFLTAVASGDLDGDGNLDAVVGAADDETLPGGVHVMLGNGDGSFQAPQLVELSTKVDAIELVDLDGDGALDLLVTDGWDDDVAVHLGTGTGAFQASVHYGIGGDTHGAAIADLDLDGELDLAANLDTPGAADFVEILSGVGGGAFQVTQIVPASDGPRVVAAADLDVDGAPDLFVTNAAVGPALSFLNQGAGTFAAPLPVDAGVYGHSAVVEDLDGDGLPDFAVGNRYYETVTLAPGLGDGTFGPMQTRNAAYTPNALLTDDWDGDGGADLAVACWNVGRVELMFDALVDPSAAFDLIETPFVSDLRDVLVHDVTGDGVLDIVGGGAINVAFVAYGVVGYAVGNGDGTFQVPVGSGTGGAPPEALAMGDLNGDGVADLVAAGNTAQQLSILLGSGGGFAPAQHVPSGSTPVDLELADLDGDGDLDAVTANMFEDSGSVLLGDGLGGLAFAANVAGVETAASVAVADLDLDGAADLALGTLVNPGVTTFLGFGDGTFAAGQSFAVPGGAWSLAAGDLDGDGLPDLAAARLSSPTVGILSGNGDGTLAPVTSWLDGQADRIAIADVTGDGRVDVVAGGATSTAGDVLVLPSNGDGTFQASQGYGAGNNLLAFALGDLDGDGLNDVVGAVKYHGFSVSLNRIGE